MHVPDDFLLALSTRAGALLAFEEGLPSPERDVCVRWIEGAADPEHRVRRIRLALDLLLAT